MLFLDLKAQASWNISKSLKNQAVPLRTLSWLKASFLKNKSQLDAQEEWKTQSNY